MKNVFYVCSRKMEKLEQEILEQATEMFMKYGLRSVSMDDLAREMAVSKKTLYKYVSNKEELVSRSVNYVFGQIKSQIEAVFEQPGNAIDELFAIDNAVCFNIKQHNPSIKFQLEKYYPDIFKNLNDKRRDLIYDRMLRNVKRGKEEKLYRPEMDAEIIARLYYSRMEVMEENEIFTEKDRSIREVMREILIYHIRGMATREGTRYLEEKLKNQNA